MGAYAVLRNKTDMHFFELNFDSSSKNLGPFALNLYQFSEMVPNFAYYKAYKFE